jgi:hypothetical protein
LTLLLYGLLAVLVIGILFVAAVYFLPRGEQLVTPTPDSRAWAQLPRGQIQPDDITAMRLPVALRGYRFAETDQLLDRLTDELRARDEEIEGLRNGRSAPAAPPAGEASTPLPGPGGAAPRVPSTGIPHGPTAAERPWARPRSDADESDPHGR